MKNVAYGLTKKTYLFLANAAAFYPGLVVPSTTDGVPMLITRIDVVDITK